MLHNIKAIYLHCVFHGIRFKVNNEDWLSVTDSLFFCSEMTYLCNVFLNIKFLNNRYEKSILS